jgi:anti-anti-sigma factor
MVFDTLPGLFIGIGASLTLLLYRASRPHVAELGQTAPDDRFEDLDRHPGARPVPGVVVLRIESGLFFANAEGVRARVRAAAPTGTTAVILDAETIPFIDISAARMLNSLAEDLARDGVRLLLARDVDQVRDVLDKTSESPHLKIHPTVREAVRVATS